MPAKKPRALNTRKETKAQRNARIASEAARTPQTQLSKAPPAELKGHRVARGVWTRLIGLYFETEGVLITAFDADLLTKYCMAEEELAELYKLRGEVKDLYVAHSKLLARIRPKPDQLKDYFGALSQANALLQRFQGLDARMDGKRKMVFTLAQSMYLTPRSRAGVAPQSKPPEEEKDELETLLDE